ncbi:MAG: hypothetical protein ACR2MP_16335 [Streptosporangiaceae bacterium]
MDWGALVGGLIGAGIPGVLAYLGLRRGRQSADAEAFGPAVLLLVQLDPRRVTFNFSPDAAPEGDKRKELQQRADQARERLLVVSAGNPRRQVRELAQVAEAKLAAAIQASGWVARDMQANRDNPGWLDTARQAHAEAETALRELISANFSWRIFPRRARRPTLPSIS